MGPSLDRAGYVERNTGEMSKFGVVAAIAAALLLAGCNKPGTSATTAPTAPTVSTFKLGDLVTFKAENNRVVGTIRFLEAIEVPSDCVIDSTSAQAIAIRVEIDNPGVLALPEPDMYSLLTNDTRGVSQPTTVTTLQSRCSVDYPSIASSLAPGKTAGWVYVGVRTANPAALLYAPTVGDVGSTANDIKLVTMSPVSATISLPTPLPRTTGQAAASVVPPTGNPAPTSAPVPPAVAQAPVTPAAGQPCNPGSDMWAKDATGQQLHCGTAGGPSPMWIRSAPFVGTRNPGGPCELGAAVAESPDGKVLICVGERGTATWAPGP